jgi:hypothetical protein
LIFFSIWIKCILSPPRPIIEFATLISVYPHAAMCLHTLGQRFFFIAHNMKKILEKQQCAFFVNPLSSYDAQLIFRILSFFVVYSSNSLAYVVITTAIFCLNHVFLYFDVWWVLFYRTLLPYMYSLHVLGYSLTSINCDLMWFSFYAANLYLVRDCGSVIACTQGLCLYCINQLYCSHPWCMGWNPPSTT